MLSGIIEQALSERSKELLGSLRSETDTNGTLLRTASATQTPARTFTYYLCPSALLFLSLLHCNRLLTAAEKRKTESSAKRSSGKPRAQS